MSGLWTRMVLVAGVAVAGLGGGRDAGANERHFTYTYETATLPAGTIELEPWTTVRMQHEDYFVGTDHRLEFEVGITDRLQSALYLNLSALAAEEKGVTTSAFAYEGFAWETKWKLMDPVADAVGLGLYFELGVEPDAVSIEAKLLIDKRIGAFNLAFNAVVEPEFSHEKDDTELEELEIEADLALGYFITDNFSIGLEIRNHNEMAKGHEEAGMAGMEMAGEEGDLEFEHSVLFAGPVISYAADRWWAALTVLPQIAALSGASKDSILDLEGHERVETRLILGMHL